MADDQKVEESSNAKAMEDKAAEQAEASAEVAVEAATEAAEAAEEVKEVVAEVKAEAPKKEAKAVSASLEKIIEQIETLKVIELADLVHALEDRFGVTASAPMALAQAPAGTATGEPVEEQTTFNVILASAGANKIGAIKAVRELVPTLGLKEAKDLVEAAPKPVMEGVNKDTANEAKTKLTAAGATVELQ